MKTRNALHFALDCSLQSLADLHVCVQRATFKTLIISFVLVSISLIPVNRVHAV